MGYIRNSLAVVDDISSTGIDTLSKGSLVHIVNGGGTSLYSLNKDITSPSMTVEQAIANGSLSCLHTETFQVTNAGGITNTDTDVTSCKLLDFEGNQNFCTSEFILHITRDTDGVALVAKIKAIYIANKLEVYVSDVICNNYSYRTSTNAVFYETSIFRDTALIGCILSVEKGNKLILNILNTNTTTVTTIETKYVSGNIFPHPVYYNRNYTYIRNLSNVNIPFKDGASNVFNNCGQIVTFFSYPSHEYIFRNGLYKLAYGGALEQFIYPSLQKVTGENKTYEVNNRYLVQDDSNRYISAELPNITGNFDYAWNGADGVFPTPQGAFYQVSRRGATWQEPGRHGTDIETVGIDASRISPIYKTGAGVKPDSVQVQYYIKLF